MLAFPEVGVFHEDAYHAQHGQDESTHSLGEAVLHDIHFEKPESRALLPAEKKEEKSLEEREILPPEIKDDRFEKKFIAPEPPQISKPVPVEKFPEKEKPSPEKKIEPKIEERTEEKTFSRDVKIEKIPTPVATKRIAKTPVPVKKTPVKDQRYEQKEIAPEKFDEEPAASLTKKEDEEVIL